MVSALPEDSWHVFEACVPSQPSDRPIQACLSGMHVKPSLTRVNLMGLSLPCRPYRNAHAVGFFQPKTIVGKMADQLLAERPLPDGQSWCPWVGDFGLSLVSLPLSPISQLCFGWTVFAPLC